MPSMLRQPWPAPRQCSATAMQIGVVIDPDGQGTAAAEPPRQPVAQREVPPGRDIERRDPPGRPRHRPAAAAAKPAQPGQARRVVADPGQPQGVRQHLFQLPPQPLRIGAARGRHPGRLDQLASLRRPPRPPSWCRRYQRPAPARPPSPQPPPPSPAIRRMPKPANHASTPPARRTAAIFAGTARAWLGQPMTGGRTVSGRSGWDR